MYTFLYKDNTDDRDCVAYIDLKDLKENHLCCDGHFNKHGACYLMSLMDDGRYGTPYEDIETIILTEDEYHRLCNPEGQDLTGIINKLESDENQKLFQKVIEEEVNWMEDEYGLDKYDIKDIFDEYYLDYRDRGIIGCVFKDAYECGYEEAYSLGYIDNKNDLTSRYFDFEQFGEDLVRDDSYYCQLRDGRIVCLSY